MLQCCVRWLRLDGQLERNVHRMADAGSDDGVRRVLARLGRNCGRRRNLRTCSRRS
jgi:hypothetical protein